VFGEMRALIRYPLKLMWYANYPPELYDLSTDPEESHDLGEDRPSTVAKMTAELKQRIDKDTPGTPSGPAETPPLVPPDVLDQLRALGYLGDEADTGTREPES
jgi:hypothetical protein